MQTILITGGTGFLGRNLSLQLKNEFNVVLTGRNHGLNAYAQKATGCLVVPMDVTNIDMVREAIEVYKPSIIIHAAATKYADIAELYPNECIDINIKGSQNVLRAAIDKQVKYVLGISTDKASPPCKGIYGTSKAIMEKLFIRMNGKSVTRFCCVRFGNIAWSTGSVFPIWKEMLDQEGIIKTTGSHMRRFMFSVHEAIQMVIDALTHIEMLQGKILAKKMKSVQIGDILPFFNKIYGGTAEKVLPRIGENIDEIMVGEAELSFTKCITIADNDYYLIDFEKECLPQLEHAIESKSAPRLSTHEIMQLITPGKKFI